MSVSNLIIEGTVALHKEEDVSMMDNRLLDALFAIRRMTTKLIRALDEEVDDYNEINYPR